MPNDWYESHKQWNAKNYKQINIAVRPELASAFRAACEQAQTPMRGALITLMTQYCAAPPNIKDQKDKGYTSRSNRRKATATIMKQLKMIRDAEEEYRKNIPINLQGSSRYEAAEQTIELLDDAIAILENAFD